MSNVFSPHEALVEEEVEVVVVVVRVAAKVRLEAVAAVRGAGRFRDENIVVRVVEAAAVVIVNGHRAVVVCQDPVEGDRVVLLEHGPALCLCFVAVEHVHDPVPLQIRPGV